MSPFSKSRFDDWFAYARLRRDVASIVGFFNLCSHCLFVSFCLFLSLCDCYFQRVWMVDSDSRMRSFFVLVFCFVLCVYIPPNINMFMRNINHHAHLYTCAMRMHMHTHAHIYLLINSRYLYMHKHARTYACTLKKNSFTSSL